jgi:predicted extracellular nuclease
MAGVCAGDTVVDDAFDPATEWDGFATDTFDGLGAHSADCDGGTDPGPADAVVNEFSASTTGTDVEFLEVYGNPQTDYSDLTILQVEGDAASSARGTAVSSHPVGTTDADGYWLADLAANTLQNGTLTLLLVSGYTGEPLLDADQDGTIDTFPFDEVVDSVAVSDENDGDLTYSQTVLTEGYDGMAFKPGGASRIPNGVDTDTVQDWMRNDFDLAGIEGRTGTPTEGEALNTPGAVNTAYQEDPLPPGGDCGDPATLIGVVQGDGAQSPLVGESVTVEGTVVGDFQSGGFDGYYVQDEGDDDPDTSDGIFVHAPGGVAVDEGDSVRVSGPVSEFFGMTQLGGSTVAVCSTGGELPGAVEVTLPDGNLERYEGMRVTFPQDLAILEFFNFGRFGEIVIGTDRQFQPTAVFEPGSAQAEALLAENRASRITLDDGRGSQNPDPAIHPNGEEFTLDNLFRGGDLVTDATGVLDFRFGLYRIQPTQGADYTVANPRPDVPEVGGDIQVASFNVLNYFTTLGSRGADTEEEFDRQEAKIVAAIAEMDSDVVGLIEIENNGTALETLTTALNDELGEERYAFVETGPIGTDVITTAYIYQPDQVTPVGDFAILTSEDDDRFLDEYNRPTLAQTFEDNTTGGQVTVAVNHLKSKGSPCDAVGDPMDPDGQGNCNGVRTDAAEAMVDWLAADPTGTGTENTLVIGDLNSYDKEDPITVLTDAGYTDLLLAEQGEFAYSYVFDGQLGYLDYAMSNEALTSRVTGADAWAINADEPSLIDYDMTFKKDAQDALYAPDPFRSSDHDPVIVGLDLADTPEDTTPPELEVVVDPSTIWPPNNKWRTVNTVVEASDDSGVVEVALVGAEAEGRGAEIEVVSDSQFEVRAVKGAVYTITYQATDPSGNTTTVSVTVQVPHDQGKGRL